MGLTPLKSLNESALRYPQASCSDDVGPIDPRFDWFRRLPIFVNLTPYECREIVTAAREEAIPRRQIIFVESATCRRQVLLVLSGCIKVTRVGSTGSEVILHLTTPGELVGAPQLYLGSHWLGAITATATQPTIALVWDAEVFKSLLDRYPNLRRNTDRLLGQRLEELERRFCAISTQRIPSRLSQQLIRLSRQLNKHNSEALEIGLTHEELAQLTGVTLFTVSRLLAQWDRLGIVDVRREAVVVCDLKALEGMSELG